MLFDATQDAFGSGTWSIHHCRRIIPDAAEVFTLEDCRDWLEFL